MIMASQFKATQFKGETEMEKYRFETGSLYEYNKESNAYICVWTNAYDNTKKKAIKSYEEWLMNN